MPAHVNSSRDPTAGKPPRPRRRFPLSLRVFIAILCITIASTSVLVFWQFAPIWAIRRVGGRVIQVRFLGPEVLYTYFRAIWPAFEVVGVDFGNSLATDAEMAHVAKMTELEFVWLNNTAVTDIGVARLTGLRKLKQLKLDGTRVTDAGAAQIESAIPGVKLER